MKYVLPAVGVALALTLSGTAYAADHDRGGQRHRDQATQQNDANHRFGRADRQRAPVVQRQTQRQWGQGRRDDDNRWRNDHRPRGPVANTNHRPPVANDWRNSTARANWNQFRRNVNAPKRLRAGAYHGPRGFRYQRWSYGQRLPAAYYARPFWLLNAIAYGLFTPPPGLIWVRYGDDALLIDQYTGEIVQVRYNVFY